MRLQFDIQRYLDQLDKWIVNRPKAVILVFLLISAGFATGLGGGGTESGTDQFLEDVPAYKAQENVQDQFERVSFESDSGTTQLVQSSTNVLSKPELLRMLRAQYRLERNPDLQVTRTTSVARAVARTLDPTADTLEAEIRAVERATPAEIDVAVRTAVERSPALRASLSEDFNAKSARASATIGIVTHSLSAEGSSGPGPGASGESPLTSIQRQAEFTVSSVGGDIRVFGSGIVSEEFSDVIGDSLALVIPAAIVLILLFLIIAYRDPFDLVLGLVSLGMAVLWTFGFMGLAGIPFTQILIAIPPLLLAVGIDFGIHAVNRYREEREKGYGIDDSMSIATNQLVVAFVIVTGTAVIGFLANVSSSLQPLREFGYVTAVGFVFTFFIFGLFFPAAKLYSDGLRARSGIPEFGTSPMGGSGDSLLASALSVGVHIGRHGPRVFLALLLVSTVGLGFYGAGVDSRFTQDDFLPPEDNPAYLEYVPEGLQPRDYTVTEITNFLEDNFATGEEDVTTVYVEGPLTNDGALESMWRAGDDPPDSFIDDGGHARETSIVTVIRAHTERDSEFAALVARNDRNANGIPDDNLEVIYEALLASSAREQALAYITDDYTAARVEYSVEADATQAAVTTDTRAVADRFRIEATATGSVVVLKNVSDVIAESAFVSLVLAIAGSAIFLVIVYTLLEGQPSLGIANLLPIVVTVLGLAATMRYLDIPFNVMTGTTLSIGVGLGTAYSVHITHRFIDEYDGSNVFEAISTTVRGTGGALTGSLVTTVSGVGVLVMAITPMLGQFGTMLSLTILYSYITSLVVLPPILVVWAQDVDRENSLLAVRSRVPWGDR